MRHFIADSQIERLRECAILQYHLRGIDAAIGTSNKCDGRALLTAFLELESAARF